MVRIATSDDLAGLSGLLVKAIREGGGRGGARVRLPLASGAEGFARELISGGAHQAIVAVEDDQLVGLLCLEHLSTSLRLNAVFVEATRRRSGIGRSLLRAAEQIAASRREEIVALVAAGSRAEKSFFEASGYRAELLVMAAKKSTPASVEGHVIACAGVVVLQDNALLLIRRGQAPGLGRWSLPGGRLEIGEVAADAARRECAEETGLEVRITGLIGGARLDAGKGIVYDVEDFAAEVVGGELQAGSDASDARFVPIDELGLFDLSDGLRDWLVVHGVL